MTSRTGLVSHPSQDRRSTNARHLRACHPLWDGFPEDIRPCVWSATLVCAHKCTQRPLFCINRALFGIGFPHPLLGCTAGLHGSARSNPVHSPLLGVSLLFLIPLLTEMLQLRRWSCHPDALNKAFPRPFLACDESLLSCRGTRKLALN